jgi:hypothetical protein
MTVLAPFAEIEASLAVTTHSRLANAVASVLDPADKAGSELAVIFDEAYIGVLEIDSVGPAAAAMDSDIAALELVQDSVLKIKGKQYAIRKMEPDGAGWTVMRFRREDC